LTVNGFGSLVELIERVSGIAVPARELERLRAIAEQRVAASGQRNLNGYVRYLADSRDSDEWRQLLARITVSESSLFRGPQQFRALAEEVIPRLRAARPGRRLRVWSAGCARGEEAASLAIVLAETLGLSGWDWRVLGTDVNEAVLEQARRARFGRRATARVEPELAERHFTRLDGELELARPLRDRIHFRSVNLIQETLSLPEAPFDVVFLRNVLIYFRAGAQRQVVEQVAANLAEDGALFVGPSESLWQLHTSLEPEDLGDCFCYRRRSRTKPDAAPAATGVVCPVTATADLERGLPGRARALPPSSAESPAEVADELERLLGQGRSERAVRRATAAARRSPDDAALRAIEGRAWELAGELERAVSAYRAALYLEPRLADVRYLLAGCLERLGRALRAQRERRSVLAAVAAGTARTVPELRPLGVPTVAEITVEFESQESGGR
jgi:chemotaxis protein methyltransferase CheR